MLTTVDEKLQLLALDSDEFSQGLANLTKFYLDNKKDDDSEEEESIGDGSTSTIIDNYLALEDNTPILTP